jgi:integrative and conjugative element protein (TIGR02256 family)
VPCETGGILIGYRTGDDVVIERTLEIPDSAATAFSYRRDHAMAQRALELQLESAQAHLGYVGEWHSHPAPAGASGQDVREIAAISRLSAHPVALLVLRKDAQERWGVSAWIASGGVVDQVELISTDD